jgi:hypothetical protein
MLLSMLFLISSVLDGELQENRRCWDGEELQEIRRC